jgi:hypothetical protein
VVPFHLGQPENAVGQPDNAVTQPVHQHIYAAIDDSDSDSDFDSDMASNTLVPAPFTGKPQEDVLEFLTNYDLWSTFRAMTGAQKSAALPLLLKDGAALWFNTQSQNTRDSFTRLREALIQRYGPNPSDAWKRSAELWLIRQLPNQTVDDFLTTVQKAAQRLGVEADQTFLVALNGLRSNIRQHVIQHDITTIEDLQKWGRLTELSLDDSADAGEHMRQTVTELAAIREELQQLHLTNVAAVSSTHYRSSSPSTRRVTFGPPLDSRRVTFEPPLDSHQVTLDQPPESSTYSTSPRDFQSRPGTFQPPQQTYSPRYSQGRPWHRFQPSYRQTSWRSPAGSTCGNCGGTHGSTNFCRAKGVTCFQCGKRGHLRSVCRSTRGRFSQT